MTLSPLSEPAEPRVRWAFRAVGAPESVQPYASELVSLFERFHGYLGEPVILTVGSRHGEWTSERWRRLLGRIQRTDVNDFDIDWIPNQQEVPYPGVSAGSLGIAGLKNGFMTPPICDVGVNALVHYPRRPDDPAVDLAGCLEVVRSAVRYGFSGGALVVRGNPEVDYGWAADLGWQFGPVAWGLLVGGARLATLGGPQKVRDEAPVHAVIDVPGGLWMELTEWPHTVKQTQVDAFREYLEPIVGPPRT